MNRLSHFSQQQLDLIESVCCNELDVSLYDENLIITERHTVIVPYYPPEGRMMVFGICLPFSSVFKSERIELKEVVDEDGESICIGYGEKTRVIAVLDPTVTK